MSVLSNRVGRIFVVLLSLCLRGVYGAVQGGLRGSRGLRAAPDAQILRTSLVGLFDVVGLVHVVGLIDVARPLPTLTHVSRTHGIVDLTPPRSFFVILFCSAAGRLWRGPSRLSFSASQYAGRGDCQRLAVRADGPVSPAGDVLHVLSGRLV